MAGIFPVVPRLTGGGGVADHYINIPAQFAPEILVELGQVGQQRQVAGFPGIDREGNLLAVGVGAVQSVSAAVADGLQQLGGLVQVKGAGFQVRAPAQGVGGYMGPAVGVDGLAAVQAVDDFVLVQGVFGGLAGFLGVAPQGFVPAVHIDDPVVGGFPLPGDGGPVGAFNILHHIDVGLNQLGVAGAQGGQAGGRLRHHLQGQGVE